MGKQAQVITPVWEEDLQSTRAHIETQLQSMQTEIQGTFEARLDEKMEQMRADLQKSFAMEIRQAMNQLHVSTASNSPSSSHSKPSYPPNSTHTIEPPIPLPQSTHATITSVPYATKLDFPTRQTPIPQLHPNGPPIFGNWDPNPINTPPPQPMIPTNHPQFDSMNLPLPYLNSQPIHIPNLHSRNLRLEFPIYSHGNPLDWISRAERYFKYYQIPENQKREIASMHFEGDVMPWIDWFKAKYPSSDWQHFVEAFLCHFGVKRGMDFNGAITKLEQGNTFVETYETGFLRLACRLPNWTDDQLKGCYISGLERELQFEVLSFEPPTLAHAMKIARFQEEKVKARRAGHKWNAGKSSPSTINFNRTHQSHCQPTPSPSQVSVTKSVNRPIKRLTNAEIQEKRDKNLCFKYDEPYRPGHQCKKAYILLMEAEDEDEEDDDEEKTEPKCAETAIQEDINPKENPTISLQALTGSPNPQTMRIQGLLGHQMVNILIDSGSTHNFVHPFLARGMSSMKDMGSTLKVYMQRMELKCIVKEN